MDEASTQTGPSDPTPSTKSLDEGSWELLLKRIRDKRCTPFLGAGMSPHPSAVDIAREWALAEGYPLADGTDLARVAQFIGVKEDAMAPKERLLTRFRSTPSPDFSDPLEPHRVLADLELPMYITTNYDRFMIEALEAPGRSPARVVCRWNESMERKKPPKPPDSANPWVFHLHGSDDDPQSLVLTEDDYLDFLVRSQQDEKMLPPKVQSAMASTSLLFIGYSLADWTFRVLFRGIIYSIPPSQQRVHVAVQLPRRAAEEAYLQAYFKGMNVRVYWGNAEEFMKDLKDRWEAFR